MMLILGTVSLSSGMALADGGRPDQREIDRRVDRLEQLVQRLDERINRLETELHRRELPAPPMFAPQTACALTNPYSKLIYMGVGNNNMDAEYGARKLCQDKDNFTSGCTATVRCEQETSSFADKTCLIENNYSKMTYGGTGKSRLEAEYQAKLACQTSDNFISGCDSGQLSCSQ